MSRPHKIGYAEVALLADDPTTRVVLSDVFTTSSSTGFIHRMRIIGVLLLSLAFYAWYAYATLLSRRSDLDRPITSWLDLPENVQRTWAMYSPYFPVEPYQPPQNCEITQVNILQRHGARYPTSGATKSINAALAKLLSVKNFTDPRLAFLEEYTYNLGQNDLVAFGAAQSYDAGREALIRYSHLVSVDNLPFVRASSSDRVVMSARNWTAGFAAASQSKYTPGLSVILSEAGNDTLDNNQCPSAGSSDSETAQWLATYAPLITMRLNAAAPHANLTDADTYSLMSLCPFESVAEEKRSNFCNLYDEFDAFEGFEYGGDLDKYYGTGYGQSLGPVQGVGYVNELLARLTNTVVSDHTQTNTTLDADPATFPLNHTLYADFSHDNQMIAIYAAMGLFPQHAALDPTAPNPHRSWRVAKLVPFSARMVVEKLRCPGRGRDGGEYVRVLVNDAVQSLAFCGAGDDGVCALDAFVESQNYSRSDGNGDWEKCFL